MNSLDLVLLSAGAAAATAVSSPLTISALHHLGVLDVPNHRSSHAVPTLRGGGLAVLAGIAVTVVLASIAGLSPPVVALAACAVLAGLGLLADTTDVGPVTRLIGQALIGAGAGSLLGDWATALIGAIVVPVLVNVVNFMDGINGITGLTMSAWAVVALLLGQVEGTLVLAALTLGGAAGFLPFNVPSARMFLGDVGSYLFGGLVATALLVEQAGGGRPLVLVAALTPYLVDVGLTLARRAARGARLTEAHREHLYQRLARRPPWTHLRVASLVATLALVAGSVALLLVGQNGML